MRWWRVTFSRAGQWADAYNVEAMTAEHAYETARDHHCRGGLWAGDVTIEPIPAPRLYEDVSITMDELADYAKKLNSKHDDVPF